MDDIISFDQILRMAFHQQDLNFKPGSEHSYSNTGYNLLARLVERVSGKSFREWTHEPIFSPIGMNHTHFHDEYSEVVPGKATGNSRVAIVHPNAVETGQTDSGSSSLIPRIKL